MTSKARVLFVDDEQRVLNAMRGMFRRKFDLFLTTEGAAAVKIASENPIDVIVADQRMPGMTGIEVLGKVRELSPSTIRILLTGYADPSAVEGSINVGEVFRFLNKPCPPQVLRETLDLAVTATVSEQATAIPEAPAPAAEQPVTRDTASADRDITSSTPPQPESLPVEHPVRIEEKAETASEQPEVGVVVYTVCAEFAETAIRTLAADRSTILATSLIKVMETIEKRLAGVLITDYTSNSARLQRMIGALKQYLPELVTIVVSDDRDTTDMINLINYGQIFRYIVRPVSPEQLRHDIDAAVVKHLSLRSRPDEIRRHTVERFPDQNETSGMLNQVLGRMREFGARRVGANGGYR